ncbi:PfkB family carbohydrate kinase [Hymenobacter lutimineralis]|nr:PfkB family carbohydrate kinase [Hymenobacter lutimineralis]
MHTAAPIVCFGEMLWDVLPTGKQPGGTPFKVAVHLQQLGQEVRLISRVGDDELGQELLAYSAAQGLDCSLVQQSETHLTGVVKATIRAGQAVTHTILNPVAWDYIRHTDALRAIVSGAAMLVYGSLATRSALSRETLYRLLQVAPFKVFDVNLRAPHYSRAGVKYLLRQADLVKLTQPELTEMMRWLGQPADEETALPWLAQQFSLQAVCLTKNRHGAALWTGNQLFTHPGFAVAGPGTSESAAAFLAVLLAGWQARQPPADFLRRACAAGALAATPQPAQPDLSALLTYRAPFVCYTPSPGR